MPVTTIGNSLILDGELQGTTGLSIQGIVKGKIEIDNTITVEKGAVIKADIKAKDVQISGEVKGNISASGNVHYMKGCTVVGNTTTARILIADGASIKGSVHINI
jgi:cytoskeletal protein CcmA (bactofilin family)|tara:strand:+ start:329 stop:643 length:315 start_codon:yes stop_codon:yes gene_type:complete